MKLCIHPKVLNRIVKKLFSMYERDENSKGDHWMKSAFRVLLRNFASSVV